jgi:ABC-type antimicrobial peptide transport system permease subunit
MRFKLIAAQAIYKWPVTILLFLALSASVTLYVYISNTSRYANRSMQLIVKKMGHNLIYLPQAAEPLDIYWSTGKEMLFNEERAGILASKAEMASRYFVAVLQKREAIEGYDLLLTGIKPVPRADESAEKGNMIKPVKKGFVRLGLSASTMLGKRESDTIIIRGKKFIVESVLAEKGDPDDYRVFINLATAQEMMGADGQIHYILAFLCQHARNVNKTLDLEKVKLSHLLPDMRLIIRQDLLQGRYLARMTTHETLYYLLVLIGAVTFLIIVITGLQEVTERRKEAGILSALGAGFFYLASLYVIKITIIASLSALVGFLVGSYLAVTWSSSFLVTQTISIATQWNELPPLLLKTVLAAIAAQCIPIVNLMKQDPSSVLLEE